MRMATVTDPSTSLDIQIAQLIREVLHATEMKHVDNAREQLRAFISANYIPLRKVSDG